jgi:hypothetical protein
MPVLDKARIKRAVTEAESPAAAADALYRQLRLDDMALGLFFCSPDYDIDLLGPALAERFRGLPLIGCTTAGEITPLGYRDGSVTGVSLPADSFTCVERRIDNISAFRMQDGADVVLSLLWEMERKAPQANFQNIFALLLIDGVAKAEERVTAAIGSELGNIPLVGGSAADNWRLKETPIFHDGRFHNDAAVVMLIHTLIPFRVLSAHHYEPGPAKAVITEADPARRIVYEINGEPAAKEYARLCGLDLQDLSPAVFAEHPLAVKIGGKHYTRGLERLYDDMSLQFACAIDKGVVFTIAHSRDPVAHLEGVFEGIRREIGDLQLVIGCECAARKVSVEAAQMTGRMSQTLMRNKVIGFSAFGEQLNTIHMNNSFTCVAFGTRGLS